MADTKVLDALGLSQGILFSTKGQVAAENFEKILDVIEKKVHGTPATRAGAIDALKLWLISVKPPNRDTLVKKHVSRIYQIITTLAKSRDKATDGEYKGDVYVANTFAEGLSTAGMTDPSQQFTSAMAPYAYAAAENILKTEGLSYTTKDIMVTKDSADTMRTEVIKSLMRTCPYMGSANIPTGLNVILIVLKGENFPEVLKTQARSSLQTMGTVNRMGMSSSGPALVELIKMGGNDQLIMMFLSVPELYTNGPEIVHENLDKFLAAPFIQVCHLIMRISEREPSVLMPHLDFLMEKLTYEVSMGGIIVMTLGNMAKKFPNELFKHRETIKEKGAMITSGTTSVAMCLGKMALASSPRHAADLIFADLVQLLETTRETMPIPTILSEISNCMYLLSSRDVLKAKMPIISKHRGASEIIFTSIDDYVNGRSLESLTLRVEVLDAKVNALNVQVAETCTNMADVIAYVDANMADMKDFLAQVAKKLPQPKRLEVVGTLRKTLILHFECARTGLEFPITSHDWSKWLKMGFSLVKAGQAVIDLGMGNPLGILKKGVECVQEIYEAYKTNDDDEFNTYITNPFLLSTEQDQLLEKLRAQGFFEVFSYDAQIAGWYLLNPEKDGKQPEGAAGEVSKVWTKKGYGVTEGLVAAASEALGMGVDLGGVSDLAAEGLAAVGSKLQEQSGKGKGDGVSSVKSATSPTTTTSSSGSVGPRAAAMKEQFGSAVTKSADQKLDQTNQTVAYQQRVELLEGKVNTLERQVATLTTSLEEVRGQRSACACVIN